MEQDSNDLDDKVCTSTADPLALPFPPSDREKCPPMSWWSLPMLFWRRLLEDFFLVDSLELGTQETGLYL